MIDARRPHAAVVMALLLSAGPLAACGRPGSPTGDRRAADAVYRVVAEACGSGVEEIATGAAVADDLVVTVAHTFERARSIALGRADGAAEPAELVWLDAERDLAILRLEGRVGPWLELMATSTGDEVTVISAAGPTVETIPATVLRRVEVTLDGAGRRAGLELAAEIGPGDSGAPVVDASGAIVGIVFATDRGEPRAWAVAASEIETALAQPRRGPVDLRC